MSVANIIRRKIGISIEATFRRSSWLKSKRHQLLWRLLQRSLVLTYRNSNRAYRYLHRLTHSSPKCSWWHSTVYSLTRVKSGRHPKSIRLRSYLLSKRVPSCKSNPWREWQWLRKKQHRMVDLIKRQWWLMHSLIMQSQTMHYSYRQEWNRLNLKKPLSTTERRKTRRWSTQWWEVRIRWRMRWWNWMHKVTLADADLNQIKVSI